MARRSFEWVRGGGASPADQSAAMSVACTARNPEPRRALGDFDAIGETARQPITAVGVPNPDLDADMAWELRDLPGIGLTFESRRLLRERRMPAMPTKPIVDRHWRERDLEGIGIRTGICGWDGGAELSRSSIPNLTARSDFRSDFGEMGVCCLSKYLMQKEWSG